MHSSIRVLGPLRSPCPPNSSAGDSRTVGIGITNHIETSNAVVEANENGLTFVLPTPPGFEPNVEIDIKPGSDPNSIKCTASNEVIAVAILTTEGFDATQVDHASVRFEGASETHVDRRTDLPRRHEEDVDGDGDTDLVLHFRLGDTDLGCDSELGILTGVLLDGVTEISGFDLVNMK